MKLKETTLIVLSLGFAICADADGDRTFGDGLPGFLRPFDVNDDGLFDEEERQAVRESRRAHHADWVGQWDTNGDGKLSPAERESARNSIRDLIEEKRQEHFAEVAGDDGCLSLEEFAAIPPLGLVSEERVAAIFERLDQDNDGCVTIDEFTARLRHHRKPEPPELPELPELPNLPEFPWPPQLPDWFPRPPE